MRRLLKIFLSLLPLRHLLSLKYTGRIFFSRSRLAKKAKKKKKVFGLILHPVFALSYLFTAFLYSARSSVELPQGFPGIGYYK